MMEDIIMIVNTCPDLKTAENIAEHLVNESLAACVNIIPNVISIYQWQNKLQKDLEYLLLIKTRQSQYNTVETRITQLHPYELPEIIAVSMVQGLDAYLNWVSSSTRKENEN